MKQITEVAYAKINLGLGLLGAGILERPLSGKLRELYGVSDKGFLAVAITFLACILLSLVVSSFLPCLVCLLFRLSIGSSIRSHCSKRVAFVCLVLSSW